MNLWRAHRVASPTAARIDARPVAATSGQVPEA